jgi:hypothetical protein
MNAAEKKQEADLSPDVDALEPTARQLASVRGAAKPHTLVC